MAYGIKRKLKEREKRVTDSIKKRTTDSLYSRGLSTEGYLGGYRQAIWDVQLMLNGIEPKDNHINQ